jgi:DNA-binding SARP family transcriptional activator
MPGLKLFLLGSPGIERDGQAIHIERHKALALLAYLAVTGEQHRRDALAALFWPEYDQSRARAALRRTLSALNTALAEDVLATDRERIGLSGGAVTDLWVDIAQFRRLLAACRGHGHTENEICPDCMQPLAAAAALYRGDFLAGFSLRDSTDFDDWQFFQAESLRRELAGVLERLARVYSVRREFETAISYARRWVALDPLHEPAQRALISLYAWSGQRQTALRQYAECARVLENELGAPPEIATTQLCSAIKDNRLPPLPEAPSLSRPGAEPAVSALSLSVRQQPPTSQTHTSTTHTFSLLDRMVRGQLVGREREVGQITACWQQANTGQGRVLAISGEAGIGKTRLGREAIALATDAGARVLIGRCDAERTAPYAPIAQWVAAALGEADDVLRTTPGYILADLLTLAPQLRPANPQITPNPALDPDLERQRIFDSFIGWCERLASQTPLLLWVEDIHWADSGTLSLLRYLAQNVQNLRLLLLLTHRDDELRLAENRGLGELLAELDRGRRTETIKLARLSRDQTRSLLATLLATEDEITTEFLDSVYNETEGNPFFVEEVCKALIEEGKLYFAGGYWRRADIKTVLIPRSIRAAILGRVERLPTTHQELLRSAAVLGREFELVTLQSMGGWDEEALISMLEHIEQTQLIAETQRMAPIRYAFAHALIPFTLRQNLSGLRLQRLHGRAAMALESLHPADFEALAHHFTAAGERDKAIAYCRQAAQRAEALYAYDTALQHLHSALNLLEDGDVSKVRLSLLEQLADLHRLAGQRGDALTTYSDALTLWRSQTERERWNGVRLCRKIGETFLHLESSAQIEHFELTMQASSEIGLALIAGAPPHPEAIRLLATLADDARGVHPRQDWDAAERYARAAVVMAEELDAPVELATALTALETVYGVRGLLRERVALAMRSVATSRDPRFSNRQEQCRLLSEAGNALLLVGDYAQSLVYLAEAETLADQLRDVTHQVWVLGLQAQCFFGLDRWDEMLQIEDKRRALEERYGHDRVGIMCFYCGLSANVAALRGDFGNARHFRMIAYNNMVGFWGGPPESGKWPGPGHY